MNVYQLLEELRRVNKIIISDGHCSLTGLQFVDKVEKLAISLSVMGVKDKKNCLLRIVNSVDSICLLFAALVNKAVVFVANPHDPVDKLCASIHKFSIYAIIADNATAITVQKKLSDLTIVRVQPVQSVGFCLALFDENNYPIGCHDVRLKEADIAIFSSGSTGEPKAIMHDIERLLLNATMHSNAVDLRADDVIGITLPLYYSYGLVANLFSGLIVKAEIRLNSQVGSVDIEWLKKNKISVLSITPYLAKRLRKNSAHLRVITVGGDVFYTNQAVQLVSDFSESCIYSTYGLTEAGPRVATHLISLDSISSNNVIPLGKPLKNVRLSLISDYLYDENYGELIVDTPTSMLGYFYGHEKGFLSNELNHRGIATGDLYETISGELFFVGRKKKVIVQGGEKIFPSMIESVINNVEGVIDVMVDSAHHREKGIVAKAYIVASENITINSIRKELLKNIPRSLLPEQFELVETIPRSITGKILSNLV